MLPTSTFKQQVEQDIWDWITNFIEATNSFYNYKFPPCPYAKAARLKGLVDVVAYESGSVTSWIQTHIDQLILDNQFDVRVMVFPAHVRWFFHVHWHVQQLNKTIISKDFYAQYGRAVQTASRYPGLFSGQPYFIVIVNRLTPVLDGHKSLMSTDYYDPWSQQHFADVVTRRQRMYEKYKKE
jgi:hypothetical protein